MLTTDPKVTETLLAKVEKMAAERARLAEQLNDPTVLADHKKVRDLSIRKSALDPIADDYDRYRVLHKETHDLKAVIAAGEDAELVEMAREELPRVEAEANAILERLLASLVNAADQSIGSVMLEIRAGVGGDEAALWAADLMAMYQKYAGARGWRFEPMEITTESGVGGIRSAVVSVSGDGAWSERAHEAGTHCVKRVPATEAHGRVHTSTATVAAMPEPREIELVIDPEDVDEIVTTAQGPGGQNVNKVSTAVRLLHKPSGIEVRMQETKSQSQNREKAWRLLRARLYERELLRRRAEESAQRLAQIGSGDRSERIRTYRYKEGQAVDHRLERAFAFESVLAGDLAPIIKALQEQETVRRLAAM